MEETDHRDRSCKFDDDAAAIGLAEMIHLKRQQPPNKQRIENDAAKSLNLGRQALLPAYSPSCSKPDPASHIKVYSYYQIDHGKLPLEAPDQLRSTRVVMVSEKCKTRVIVSYPSSNSLIVHLSASKAEVKMKMPTLDEKYGMEPEEAGEVLYRRVSPDEIDNNKNLWAFWVRPSYYVNVVTKKGWCWSELKSSGMLNWAKRKKVQFLTDEHGLSSYDHVKVDNNGDGEEVKSDQSGEEVKNYRKRKRHVSTSFQKTKKKKKVARNSIDRWSKERYKLAEVNMLKILKEKGAVFGKPILRPALRTEARKLIGDTGLLDHLLKHMAGKVAPGGQERFRRRHNADGAMEYWLESAELVNIRKEAGIQDPYWTPPPGWNPGDNPTQDPVCAMEFKQLKEEMANMRRDMQELLSKKQDQDDVAVVNTPSSCVTSHNFEHDSFLTLKEWYVDLMNKKAKLEEQIFEISQSLCGMEQEMEKLKSSVEEPNKEESAPTPLLKIGSTTPPLTGAEKETKEVKPKQKQIVVASNEKQEDDNAGGKTTTVPPATTKTTPEEKAAKIKRLKSGFRICRPPGTFLWPDMAMSPQSQDKAKVVVPLEDLFAVPTPPSVSSSSTSSHYLLSPLPQCGQHPTSPVKPLPERRPLTVTLTTAHPLAPAPETQYVKNTTSTKTSDINLNVVPNQNDNGSFGSQSSQSNSSTSHIIYQRRHNNETNSTAVRCLGPAKQEDSMSQGEEYLMECEQRRRGCSTSASSSASCLSTGGRSWLALATSEPPSDRNSKRG